MSLRDHGDDDAQTQEGRKKVYKEFNCPECDANNPYDDGFRAGDEVRCFYCGSGFKVIEDVNNKLKFKEV